MVTVGSFLEQVTPGGPALGSVAANQRSGLGRNQHGYRIRPRNGS